MNCPIHIPSDSYLTLWYNQFDNTELWPTWRIATGLGMIGAVLGRNTFFPFGETGAIWPNTSVILVGESGDGKDTIIRAAERVMPEAGVRFVAGKTIEAVKLSLFRLGDPAVGYIGAKELAEFLGQKDYQGGIMESLTDILSNGDRVDVSLKSDLIKGEERWIYRPTLTMFAGSTPDWLQTNLPEGALGGGFLPRFIVLAELNKEAAGIPHVPNPGKYRSTAQRDLVHASKSAFQDQLVETARYYKSNTPVVFTETNGVDNAEGYFANWYINRFKYFSPALKAYANRAGGLMLKIAMLMAVSRGHRKYIEEIDYQFAADFIVYIARNLERAVIAPSKEVSVGHAVLDFLHDGPAPQADVLRLLGGKYGPLWIKRAITYLTESAQIKVEKGNLVKL